MSRGPAETPSSSRRESTSPDTGDKPPLRLLHVGPVRVTTGRYQLGLFDRNEEDEGGADHQAPEDLRDIQVNGQRAEPRQCGSLILRVADLGA